VVSTSQKLLFPNARGQKLAASLEMPATAPRAYALFAHCFTCSKDVAAASRISRGLREEGYAVLRFDFTGLGGSEGDFANTDFSSNVEDLVAAADFLRTEHGAPRLLVGHSLGGAAVLVAASRIPEVSAVATLAAPSEPEHLKHLLTGRVSTIQSEGSAEVSIGGRPFRIRREFLEDLEEQSLREGLGNLDRALLILHSPRDGTVGIEHAARLFQAARHPKSFVSLDDADHLLSRREDSDYAARILAAWAARYVEDPPP
jgi:putative redox protein